MEKGVLRNFTKFTGKHLCQSLFFDKSAGLRPANLLKKKLWLRCFPVKFVKFLGTFLYLEHLRWLLLYFGTSHDKIKSLNSLRKDQFIQSTSNDLKKFVTSSDSIFMQILRVTHIAGFEWLECAQNVMVPDSSL